MPRAVPVKVRLAIWSPVIGPVVRSRSIGTQLAIGAAGVPHRGAPLGSRKLGPSAAARVPRLRLPFFTLSPWVRP